MRRAGTWLTGGLAAALVTLGAYGPALAASGTAGTPSTPAGPLTGVRTSSAGPVVVIGAGGLRWSDLSSSTPALQDLLDSGAIAALTVRTVNNLTCPVDGWLVISSGRSSTGSPRADSTCREPKAQIAASGSLATVPDWSTYTRLAAAGSFGARPGLLGKTLAGAGVSSAAIGPGAVIALANTAGEAPKAWPGVPALPSGAVDPQASSHPLLDAVTAALATHAQVIVIDAGSIRQRGSAEIGEPTRGAQVLALDERISLVRSALPASATVIVAGLADSGPTRHLSLLAATGPAGSGGSGTTAFAGALLRTASSRQDALVQLTDLMPSILHAVGVKPPPEVVGSPLEITSTSTDPLARYARVAGLDLAATAIPRLIVWFWTAWALTQLLVYGSTFVILRTGILGPRSIAAVRRAMTLVTLAAAAAPAASFLASLAPWWSAAHQGLTLLSLTAALAGVFAVVAVAGPWRRHRLGPAAAVAALTAATLLIDAVLGSPMQVNSLLGDHPGVDAARFFGFGNMPFAIVTTAALLAAGALAQTLHERRAEAGASEAGGQGRVPQDGALGVVLIGVLVIGVDLAPALGSDFGGPLAALPAFAYLTMRVAGLTITPRRLALVVGATVGLITVVSVADWLRPSADRSHLGRFVQEVLDGRALGVLSRKAAENFDITGHPALLLVPLAGVLIGWVLMRPERARLRTIAVLYRRSPMIRSTFAALGILWFIGYLSNDSGWTIPIAGWAVALPLLYPMAEAAGREQAAQDLAEALAAARRPAKGKGRRRP